MTKLNINNAQFYYELHGKGEPLVLISGLKSDHTGWMPVLDSLAKKFQVLIFDNRGVGRTIDSEKPFNVETMTDDVIKMIEALDIKKPHLVGHSLGGAITQTLAKKHPEKIRSIALCNTFIKFNDIGRMAFTEVLKLYQANEAPAKIMDSIIPWVFSSKFLNPELIALIQKVNAENPYPQSISGYQRQLQALYAFDSSSWIQSIEIPTLVIGSDEDKVATLAESQEITQNITGAKLVSFPTGHASQVEKPELFVEALNQFYTELKTNISI